MRAQRPAEGLGCAADSGSARQESVGSATFLPASIQIWGVLNVTPDSFSDGGAHLDPQRAIARGRAMRAEGADVIDVGGASSRPAGLTYGAGAETVGVDEEIARTRDVVRALASEGLRVSIDTTSGAVARVALEAGAVIVNDVSMGADATLLAATAEHGAELVLMHNRDGGRVLGPRPAEPTGAVLADLGVAIERAVRAGVEPGSIWIDPGIGFAKTAAESATLLRELGRLTAGPHRVLVGASRKSFLGMLAPDASGAAPSPTERLGGSLAAVTAAVMAGAAAVRVHDVRDSRQAALVALALSPRSPLRRDDHLPRPPVDGSALEGGPRG